WFHKGSEKGDSFAIHNLAGSYLEGKGVKKNHELAIEWYEKSAELGYIEAMRDLHHLYNDGEIVPKDAEKAEHWKLKFFEANLKEGGQ
ncbi:MAG: tetratricopeptide repeat protein, partial [Akkermansiaceae bacterium]